MQLFFKFTHECTVICLILVNSRQVQTVLPSSGKSQNPVAPFSHVDRSTYATPPAVLHGKLTSEWISD